MRGYVDALWRNDDALLYLQGRGLTTPTIRAADLGYAEDRDLVSIPVRDAKGRVRTIRYRFLNPVKNKYDTENGRGAHLYGVELVDEPEIYLTEGEFDALILRQLGYAAIGVPGATAFKREWRFLFRNCDLVHVVMDADEEGRRGTQRVVGAISTVTDVRVVSLPDGMDPTDVYLEDPELLGRLL